MSPSKSSASSIPVILLSSSDPIMSEALKIIALSSIFAMVEVSGAVISSYVP